MKKLVILLILALIIILSGCGGNSATDSINPGQTPTAAVINIPTPDPPVSPEQIEQMVQTDNNVTGIVDNVISSINENTTPEEVQANFQKAADELKTTAGVKEVVADESSLTVTFENGGSRAWLYRPPPSDEAVELPPEDVETTGSLLSKGTVGNNQAVIINALYDNPLWGKDKTYLDLIEKYLTKKLNFNVKRLNGSQASINEFKLLSQYGVIVYNGYGAFLYIQTGEEVKNIQTDGYQDDIYYGRIVPSTIVWGSSTKDFYSVKPGFFYKYNGNLSKSLFYNGAPCGFGYNYYNYPDKNMASFFHYSSSPYIGWTGPQNMGSLSGAWLFYYLSNKKTVADAFSAMDKKYKQQKIGNWTSAELNYLPISAGTYIYDAPPVAPTPTQPADETYYFIKKWGTTGTGNGQFRNPFGIAVTSDPSGDVYVADTNNFRIQKFTSSGEYITQWGGLASYKVTVDQSGNVYALVTSGNNVIKFDSSGKFLFNFTCPTPSCNISVDSSGYIYAIENGPSVYKFKPDVPNYIKKINLGNKNHGIIVDSYGNIYSSNYIEGSKNWRLNKYDPNGNPIILNEYGQDSNYYPILAPSLAFDISGNIYFLDILYFKRVLKFNPNGRLLTQFGSYGNEDGKFLDTTAIAVNVSGDIYVVDYGVCPTFCKISSLSILSLINKGFLSASMIA